jgi:hypothetical protein
MVKDMKFIFDISEAHAEMVGPQAAVGLFEIEVEGKGRQAIQKLLELLHAGIRRGYLHEYVLWPCDAGLEVYHPQQMLGVIRPVYDRLSFAGSQPLSEDPEYLARIEDTHGLAGPWVGTDCNYGDIFRVSTSCSYWNDTKVWDHLMRCDLVISTNRHAIKDGMFSDLGIPVKDGIPDYRQEDETCELDILSALRRPGGPVCLYFTGMRASDSFIKAIAQALMAESLTTPGRKYTDMKYIMASGFGYLGGIAEKGDITLHPRHRWLIPLQEQVEPTAWQQRAYQDIHNPSTSEMAQDILEEVLDD